MDLKILVVVLPIIVFISINALPTGDGSGGKSRVSQSGVFQDDNRSIKIREEGEFLFEDGEDDLPWLWITLGILCFLINCIMIIVCFKYCC